MQPPEARYRRGGARRPATVSGVLKFAGVCVGVGHVFLAGAWFHAGNLLLGIASIVVGLAIPGLLFLFG